MHPARAEGGPDPLFVHRHGIFETAAATPSTADPEGDCTVGAGGLETLDPARGPRVRPEDIDGAGVMITEWG